MNKSLREKVHAKYNRKCGYCGRDIQYKEMQVDHIHPRCAGGTNEPNNLMPTCRQCNHYKRDSTLEMFRIMMKSLHQRVEKIYIHRVAVNFGMATLKPWDGVFYFEKHDNTLKPQ